MLSVAGLHASDTAHREGEVHVPLVGRVSSMVRASARRVDAKVVFALEGGALGDLMLEDGLGHGGAAAGSV